MWAGSHHLLYTSLPDWVQSVGVAFSVLLLMPSLGSAANGLLTFNGSWGMLRTDGAARFMVLALVCYAGSTFEGSMMAIKSVNSLTHDTDWTVAHVHFGAIGWVAMIAIGSLYAMAPKALGREQMHSPAAMRLHFWLHLSGLLIYVSSMWASGLTAGLMWRATEPDGTLTYSFLSSLIAVKPYYFARFCGGLLVLSGMIVMFWNLWRTAEVARTRTIEAVLIPMPEEIHEPTPLQTPPPLPATA
jgi:cytochrome c oxidase cbb3-type subunit 1